MTRHRARKRFGQHFLVDEGVLHRIQEAVRPSAGDRLLEIGPGHGALTECLYGGVARYVAVELDRDLIAPLKARFEGIEIVSGDILRLDLDELLIPPPWRLVGNLPYNISSPLLDKLFLHLGAIRDMHFMFQREFGRRLGAVPGTKDWGRLSVMTQYYCEVESLFDVAPEAFAPPPKVHSQVVRLRPREMRPDVDPVRLREVLRRAFSGRRKRVGNALKTLELDWDQAAVDPGWRPDQLSVEDFVNLANALVGDSDGRDE